MKKKLVVLLNLFLLLSCTARQMRIEDVKAPKSSKKGDGYIFISELAHLENNFYRRSMNDKLELIFECKDSDVDKIAVIFGGKSYNMESIGALDGKEYFSVEVDNEDASYYFKIEDGNFDYYYGKKGCYEKNEVEKLSYKRVSLEKSAFLNGRIWYKIYVDSFRNGIDENDPLFNEFGPGAFISPRGEYEDGTTKESLFTTWGDRREKDNLGNFTLQSWTEDFNKVANWEKVATKKYPWTENSLKRFGGDLQGVEEQLAYIEELGATAVWLSPVFYSYSGNKNDIIDYRHISPDFGFVRYKVDGVEINEYELLKMKNSDYNILGESLDPSTWTNTESDKVFISLINKLKEKDMKLMLDINFSYVSDRFFAFDRLISEGPKSSYLDWFKVDSWSNIAYEDLESWNPLMPYEGQGKIGVEIVNGLMYRRAFVKVEENYSSREKEELKKWNKENLLYKCHNDRKNLPELNLENEELKSYLFESAAKWVDYGVDAYSTEYGEEVFYNELEAYLRTVNENAVVVYNHSGYQKNGDIIGAYINYRNAGTLYKYLAKNSKQYTYSSKEFISSLKIFGFRKGDQLSLNMLESEYTDRFISALINPNRQYDENNNQDRDGYLGIKPELYDAGVLAKFRTAVAVQYTLMGSPVIYYGSEKGMWGGDVPHNRKAMLWDDYKPFASESDYISKYASYKDKLSDKIVYDEVGAKVKYEVAINEELEAYYKKWNEIYKEYNELLLKGDFEISLVQEGLVVYERNYEDYGIVVAINSTDEKITTEYLVNKGKKYFNPFVADVKKEEKSIKTEGESEKSEETADKKEEKTKETSVIAGAIEISVEGRDVLVLIRDKK